MIDGLSDFDCAQLTLVIMGWGKRRRGKQSSATNTNKSEEMSGSSNPTIPSTLPPLASSSSSSPSPSSSSSPPDNDRTVEHKSTDDVTDEDEDSLVLTSEKRRGVYECDYCHSDISQLPRIRCAVCSDFDLCLDCFATTDHSSAIARWKAAATAHSELAADGIASTLVAGLSCANHDETHGYRVCDSTRYPIFGATRSVIKLMKSTEQEKDEGENSNKASGGGDTAHQTSINATQEYRWIVTDDPKIIWTAEEDLRLLDAIKTHGLGNWTDISDAVGGNGSVGKTPKRCMERYFDDFLGRYGHILPQYTIVEENGNGNDDEISSNYNGEINEPEGMDDWEEESGRSSKRRQFTRLPSNISTSSSTARARKRFKVVPTETLPGYTEIWPEPYLPQVEGVTIGLEVARDLSTKNELAFVKATAAAATQEEVEKIRLEWEEKRRKQKIGAPTVLPPRPEDTATLPGAELVGFMPRRGDFDIEFDNEAENTLADMEFLETDTEQEKQLKLQVLQIYYQKQNEREQRKQFILSRNLYDYRKYVKNEQDLPQDERDLRHRMRLFERFHTPQEHKLFIDDIIKAKRLRKEIAKLQMYRRIGIRSLAEAEKYELDKARRQFHKGAQLQKEAEGKTAATTSSGAIATGSGAATTPLPLPTTTNPAALPSAASSVGASSSNQDTVGEYSLWKNYRTSDRKIRRRISQSTATEDTQIAKIGVGNVDDSMQLDEDNASKYVSTDHRSNTANEAQRDDDDADHDDFDISTARGYDLLSRPEAELCIDLRIYPVQYLEIKKALIQESLTQGLLDKEGPASGRRMVVKLDVKRRGDIIDFMLRAGWISTRLAEIARTVTPPPSTIADE